MAPTVGYARTSTLDQVAGFEEQLSELKKIGATKIFREQVSSVAKRDQLDAALDYLREGDTFVVTKLDRLARSMKDLLSIVDRIAAKGATLKILAMDLDTSTPTGKLMLGVLGSVAQFEREMMLERQVEGIKKAQREGKYKGRAPTARNQTDDALRLQREGVKTADIAKRLGISRASAFRIVGSAKAAT